MASLLYLMIDQALQVGDWDGAFPQFIGVQLRSRDIHHLGQLLGGQFLIQAGLLQARANDVRAQPRYLADVEPHAWPNKFFSDVLIQKCLNGRAQIMRQSLQFDERRLARTLFVFHHLRRRNADIRCTILA